MKREDSVMVEDLEKFPLTPEESFRRVAVKKGYITESQLVEALEIQMVRI